MHRRGQPLLPLCEWQAEGWPYLWCATEGGGRAIVLYVFFAESKVSQDDVSLRIEQDILRLQVTVGRDEGRQVFVRRDTVRIF